MEQAVLAKQITKPNIAKQIIKYAIIFVLMYLLCVAKVVEGLFPFRVGLFLALSFVTNDYLVVSVVYFVASILGGFNLQNLISSAVASSLVILLALMHHKLKVKATIPVVVFYVILISVVDIYFMLASRDYVLLVISLVLNMVFTVACFCFLKAWIKRSFCLQLNIDELVCGALIVVGVFCGVSNINFFNIDFIRLFAVLTLLVTAQIFPTYSASIIGCLVGLGCALGGGSINHIALFCLMGVVCSVFKNNIKIFMCIACIFVDILFGWYFEAFLGYGIENIIVCIIASCIFLIVPNKLFILAKTTLFNTNYNFSYKNLINQDKFLTSRRLLQLSDVFFEMDKSFRKLVKGNLEPGEAKRMLVSELISCTCDNCPNKNKCLRSYGRQMQDTFEELVDIGFEKSRITLLDIPSLLTTKCNKVNDIVNSTNGLLIDYKKYSSVITNLDSSRVLIAEQLNGVSKILKNLSVEVNDSISFDSDLEKRISEELSYKEILANEVCVYQKNKDICKVSIVVKNSDVDNLNITSVISRVCKTSMELDSVVPTQNTGLTVMNFKTAPKYNVMFGLSNTSKVQGEISGDTHSIIDLGDDKYLLALCDGMGSGDKANKASTLAISLIENFYKAGFDNETILSSVNKLLNLGRDDVFSALDLCVIDLKSSILDFIKVGATFGFIKHLNTTTIIESGALPMGILQQITPKIIKTAIDTNDMVVLVSDGIVDSFENENELKDYINNIQNSNPQGVSDEILQKAISNNLGVPKDDMTVLVARIFCKEK